jgi:hypothetical protein
MYQFLKNAHTSEVVTSSFENGEGNPKGDPTVIITALGSVLGNQSPAAMMVSQLMK